MEEQLITFETAKLAKEKEFIRDYCTAYNSEGKLGHSVHSDSIYDIAAPTQSLLQKWIRENHNTDIIVTSNLIGYGYLVYQRYPPKTNMSNNVFQKYEEALEEGLKEALNLIK